MAGGNAPANQPRRSPYTRYCPVCKSDLVAVPSVNQPAGQSSRYQCPVCDRSWEINIISRTPPAE